MYGDWGTIALIAAAVVIYLVLGAGGGG